MFIARTVLNCCLLFCCCGQLQAQESHDLHANSGFLAPNRENAAEVGRTTPHVAIKINSRKERSIEDHVNPSVRSVLSASLGYELIDNLQGFYKVHKDEQTWYNAKKMCEQEQAHLLVINSKQEADSVRKLVERKQKSNHHSWIGIHDKYEKGNYVTILNESLGSTGFATWGQGEPDGRPGEDCGIFGNFDEYNEHNYTLGDWLCTTHLPYICEQESLASLPSEEGPTLEGYKMIPHLGYYKKHSTEKTWQEAVDICHQEGGHLVIIDSPEEHQAIWEFLKESHMYCMWTGEHRQSEHASFVTILNRTNEYHLWWPSRPREGVVRNCLNFCYGSYDSGSAGAECESTNKFVCELEL